MQCIYLAYLLGVIIVPRNDDGSAVGVQKKAQRKHHVALKNESLSIYELRCSMMNVHAPSAAHEAVHLHTHCAATRLNCVFVIPVKLTRCG